MGVKAHPTWEGWYILDIRNGESGPRERINYQGTYEEAQREYWRLKGSDPAPLRSKTCLRDLLGEFLTWYGLEHSADTVKDFLYAWRQLEPHFGGKGFHHIDSAEVDRYKAKRLADTYLPGKKKEVLTAEDRARMRHVSKRTITRELAYLSSYCKWAREKGYTQYETKIRGFPKKQTRAPIPDTHSFAEIQRTIEETGNSRAYNADRRGLTLLMYDAGLRKKEARLIQGERVDIPPEPVIIASHLPPYYGSIRVIRKGEKEVKLPILTERLYRELQARKKSTPRGYLYLNPTTKKPYRDIRAGLKSAAKRAGVTKPMTNHLLRHDFTTHLHEGGADLKTIQELLSHAEIGTTLNIYDHLHHDKLAQHAGTWAAKVDAQGSKKEAGQKNTSKALLFPQFVKPD